MPSGHLTDQQRQDWNGAMAPGGSLYIAKQKQKAAKELRSRKDTKFSGDEKRNDQEGADEDGKQEDDEDEWSKEVEKGEDEEEEEWVREEDMAKEGSKGIKQEGLKDDWAWMKGGKNDD